MLAVQCVDLPPVNLPIWGDELFSFARASLSELSQEEGTDSAFNEIRDV
jgi:hypothetical protein